MEKNKSFFENGEADEWFKRNLKSLNKKKNCEIELLVDWLKPFADEF